MISFIIQGPVENITAETILSIERHYPNSEIIISSTNNKTIEGHKTFFIEPQNNNWNYHIESSKMVIHAKHNLVCKLRSDIIFINNNLRINNENRSINYKLFNSRITCCNYHFCDPFITLMNYHPSDWLLFGEKDDVYKMFNVPKYEREETVCKNPFRTQRGETVEGNRVKKRPEQHFFINALRNSGYNIDIEFDYDNSDQDGIKWLINNFYILDAGEMAGFYCAKYPSFIGQNYGYINHHNWKKYLEESLNI
jgi:hypothetical protein